ncbi:MAG TPA: GAF domain-containing sensor histidine kinase [Marmoricola sp.]
MAQQASNATLVRAGWVLAALAAALYATIPLSLAGGVMARPGIDNPMRGSDLVEGLVLFPFVISGAWIVARRARNVIGWLVLGSGFLQAVQMSFEAYAARALTDPDRSLPLGLPVMWVASWTWMLSLALVVAVLPGLYPSGQPASRFWRWQVRLATVGIVLLLVLAGTTQGGVDDVVAGTRLPWDVPGWWMVVIGIPAGVLVVGSVLVALVGTLVRALRATAPERQQLLWLFAALLVMVVNFFSPYEWAFVLAYAVVPVAVAVGVLRYRLLGIEIALRRTLLYAPLTLLVALVVGGSTTALARLVPDGPLPLVIGSAVVAVLVFPVAGWLRTRVDRFVLGERADPLAVVDQVGAGLEVATDDPVPSMLQAVATATGSSGARATDAGGRELARVGHPDEIPADRLLTVPLRHGGREIGTLTIGPRGKEPRVTSEDSRLVAALAPHLAVVVTSRALTEELARERARVTEATLAERDRLRRDLHDGLGPSLSGIALGLEAATRSLVSDTATAREIIERTRDEASGAVAEIRRVLDGLRPSALDRVGLVGAVQETATALGMNRPGGVTFGLEVALPRLLAPQVEEAAFRIVAESLTNVSRHSGARRCDVSLAGADALLAVTISDDGAGIDEHHQPGHGLESMRRRAAELGGRLVVASSGLRGTTVRAELPLEVS